MLKFNVTDDKPADELEIAVDFESKSLPMFMAPLVLNSKLYMVGGINLQKVKSDLGYFETLSIARSTPDDEGLNRHVYLLDPADGPHISVDIPSPHAPKTHPKVFVLDGKVYLLASFEYYYDRKIPAPAFECFDPQHKSWTTLPEPPFYRDPRKWGKASRIINCCAFGRYIFITNDIDFAAGFGYNVDDREWKYYSWLPYCALPSSHGGCCVEQTNKDALAVVHTESGLLVCHLAPDGTPRRWQHLSNLYSLTGFPPLPDREYRLNGKVCHIRDDKYCLLVSRTYESSHILYVATFQVKFKTHVQDGDKYDDVQVGEQDFVDSHLLYTRQYDVQVVDNPIITLAFSMLQDHNKRSGEYELSLKLDNLELAANLPKRENLPGADSIVVQRFQELFAQAKYKEAAEIAAELPQILRTPDTLAKIQRVPCQAGQTPPLLLYFVTLLDRGKLLAFESLEFSRLVVNQNKKDAVKDMLAKGKLECSEELGDLVKTFDKDLALVIYYKAVASPKVIAGFAERREFDKILIYSKAVGYTPDYLSLLQTAIRVNPKGAVTFAVKMSQMEGGCPVDYNTIADLFIQRNLIPEATAFLLDVLKPNLPEHASLQTKVLEINLVSSPDVAGGILARGMFSHYDRPKIALLCQKAGLIVQD